jgi:hypothetical protein
MAIFDTKLLVYQRVMSTEILVYCENTTVESCQQLFNSSIFDRFA